MLLSHPPITSTNSGSEINKLKIKILEYFSATPDVSLNGELSKPRFFGEQERMKP